MTMMLLNISTPLSLILFVRVAVLSTVNSILQIMKIAILLAPTSPFWSHTGVEGTEPCHVKHLQAFTYIYSYSLHNSVYVYTVYATVYMHTVTNSSNYTHATRKLHSSPLKVYLNPRRTTGFLRISSRQWCLIRRRLRRCCSTGPRLLRS